VARVIFGENLLEARKHTSGVKTPCRVVSLDAGDESPAYRVFPLFSADFAVLSARGSSQEMGGDWVDFVGVVGVDIWIVLEVASLGVLGDVTQLILEVFGVADAVLVEAGLPDSAWRFEWQGVGEAAFNALGTAFDGLVFCGS